MASMFISPLSLIFMTEPLPNCFSIWLSAISRALSRSTAVSFCCFAVQAFGCWAAAGAEQRRRSDEVWTIIPRGCDSEARDE